MHEIDSYVGMIDELVEDDNKIVTYKMLSHHLALPVNKSKQILKDYLKSCESSDTSALYALTGRSNGKITVTIVPECNLEQAKKQFNHVLSCHIYSIQKAKVCDPSLLYGVDYDLTKNNLYQCGSYGMIKYTGSKQLSEEEIKAKRFSKNTNEAVPSETFTSKKPASNLFQKQSTAKKAGSFFSPKPSVKVKKDAATEQDRASKDEGVKESDSAVSNGKSKSTPDTIIPRETKTPPQKPKKRGMDMFLTKEKTDPFKSTAEVRKSPVSKDQPADISLNDSELIALSEKMDVDDVCEGDDVCGGDDVRNDAPIFDADKSSPVVEEPPSVAKDKTNQNVQPKTDAGAKSKPVKKTAIASNKSTKLKSLSRKPKSTSSKNAPTKKRKRIQEFSSSSSSESEEDFDNVDVIPPSPPQPKVAVIAPKNPRKKRVLKSRTFVDDEGFMVTDKVWEEISCSSEDEDLKDAKENRSPPEVEAMKQVTKKASFKGKQSSIMGFFSKTS